MPRVLVFNYGSMVMPLNGIPDCAILEEDVDECPADVGAAEAVHEEVAGEAQQLEVVGHRPEDREPDLGLEVLERSVEVM